MDLNELKTRRISLISMMPNNSIAILSSANKNYRTRDVENPYRQNSDFLYLTGISEPNLICVIFKEENIPNIMTKYYSHEYEHNFKRHNNFELLVLNRNDARSTLLKIINEFGLFSIYFFIIGIKFLLNRSLDINFKLTISTLLITQFITGAGYFNGGFVIFLFLMIVLNDAKQRI